MRQAGPHVSSRNWHVLGYTCAVMLAAAVALTGCGYGSSKVAADDGKPTLPPSSATSAYWTVTPYLATPASIAGWQTYTDSAYHFKTVIPPGWRLGTVLDTTSSPQCEYDVVYFPPGDTRAMEQRVWIGMQEYMLITVYLQCPFYDPAKDPNLTRVSTVTISGGSTPLYGQDNNQEVDRVAYTQFGGHPYGFYLTASHVSESRQYTAITSDVPLYLGVLSGFEYLGGK